MMKKSGMIIGPIHHLLLPSHLSILPMLHPILGFPSKVFQILPMVERIPQVSRMLMLFQSPVTKPVPQAIIPSEEEKMMSETKQLRGILTKSFMVVVLVPSQVSKWSPPCYLTLFLYQKVTGHLEGLHWRRVSRLHVKGWSHVCCI